jgi:AmmeMemoRadiSam system protein B
VAVTEPVRPAAVAGTFYPADPGAVAAALDRLLPPVAAEPARAVVVPHAGWTYSGAVAGATYARVVLPRLAVLLGPNHFGVGAPGAVWAHGAWEGPAGLVPVATALAAELLAASRHLHEDLRAHAREHSLEVQLPFLRRRRPDVAVVPVLLGRTDPAFCRAVGDAIGRVLAGWAEPVLLVDSTDLNHYEDQATTERKDRLALDAILGLDPEGLQHAVRVHEISMCGLAPTLVLLHAAPWLGIRAARLVRHATSGDVSGDRDAVVGYAGIVLT